MSEPIIRVEHITKNFRGLKAVNDLSLTVEEGGITGMIGPNDLLSREGNYQLQAL
ncbi:MAG: hypothetical protein SPF89_12130 [Sphaerochaetaceae bacterium]|nr:hypothetical protein [Spirochaetales bacterium]MDY5500841.1 hypothetical protein [Sphaerochaetaceae bacterium]